MTTTVTTPSKSLPPGRRTNRLRRLIVAVLVLGGLLVGADFALAAVGEYQVAQKMRQEFQLTDDPAVRINKFPFLAQAISGDYKDIVISATGVPVRDQLRDLEIRANLRNVRIGLSDLLSGDMSKGKIDFVSGSIRINASDINRVVNQITPFSNLSIEPDTRFVEKETPKNEADTGSSVRAVDHSKAAVKISGETTIASKKVKITAFGVVALVGNQVSISVNNVQLDDKTLAGLTELMNVVQGALSVTVNPGVLPFTVTPTAIKVDYGALIVEGTARDIPLAENGN